MGEVYRATDTTLKRQVAIKLLPAAVAADGDRLARFQREAEVLASLNHPNIAHLYGIEEGPSEAGHQVRALVMELVEGPTLAQRIAQGPLAVAEALPIATQIAEALEAAHERGIIHRDLKPANVKLTPHGRVKVLDFGLAKAALPPESGGSPSALSQSPTLTSPAVTAYGVILGTAAYMSPEQARGRTVDARSDIWAFGAVLYEMLTGTRVFEREDVSETLAAILRDDPDWARLPPELPPAIRAFLKRCLRRDPAERVHHIADMRLALGGAFDAEDSLSTGGGGTRRLAPIVALVSLAIAVVAVGAALWLARRSGEAPPRQTRRFPLTLPAEHQLPGGQGTLVALSPDGQTLVYVAQVNDVFQLIRRRLDQLEGTPIPGTENTNPHPFFSHDGRWLGFHFGSVLMKVPVAGGRPVRIATLPITGNDPRGASWSEDDTIIVAARAKGLIRVSANGGEVSTIVKPDDNREYWYPQVLPGGRAVIFTASQGAADAGDLLLADLGTRQRRTLVRDAVAGYFVAPDHLVFVRGGDLWAVRFDADRLQVSGDPVTVQSGVRVEFGGATQVAIDGAGSMAYIPRDSVAAPLALVWVSRDGREEPLDVERRAFESPRVSPDGRRVAVTIREGNADVWVHHVNGGGLSRLTFDPGEDESPLWRPDGQAVAYAANRGSDRVTLQRAADGTGDETRLGGNVDHHHLSDWSRDGRAIAFEARGSVGTWDVWSTPVAADSKPRAMFATEATERGAALSPNGEWVAYESTETGQSEIYVQAFPDGGRKRQISTGGGTEPIWSSDGRELFYRSGERVMSADMRSALTTRPQVLFEGRYERLPWGTRNYDVSPDGRRFVMIKASATGPSQQIVLVQHLVEELKRLLPGR